MDGHRDVAGVGIDSRVGRFLASLIAGEYFGPIGVILRGGNCGDGGGDGVGLVSGLGLRFDVGNGKLGASSSTSSSSSLTWTKK
mmetsp:Transcript_103319/g.210848  ORF Transcript_103319/g.210848 Transcript_103319/m.210848 type:complete len:84 (-) Transcript_103319:52-303(-)